MIFKPYHVLFESSALTVTFDLTRKSSHMGQKKRFPEFGVIALKDLPFKAESLGHRTLLQT